MEEISIELKDGYKAVKAIYYQNGLGSIFTYYSTKWLVIFTISSAILSVIFYVISLIYQGIGWIALMAICSMVTIIGFIFSVTYGMIYFKRKKGIDQYLDQIRKYDTESLTLTQRHIEMSNSDSTTFEKWAEIAYVSLKKDYILLKSANRNSYIFPEKSMDPHQFVIMVEFIRQKMESNSFKIDQDSDS
jgi:hypothetical protein